MGKYYIYRCNATLPNYFFLNITAHCGVHTFAVDGRHRVCLEGNYSVPLHTNYTNYQRYGFLKICLPSSLLSVMIPMLLIFLEGCAILCPGYRQIRSRWRRFLWWRDRKSPWFTPKAPTLDERQWVRFSNNVKKSSTVFRYVRIHLPLTKNLMDDTSVKWAINKTFLFFIQFSWNLVKL